MFRFKFVQENSFSDVYRCPLELNMLCGAPRETALLAAVRGGYTDVVEILLDNGADPNVIACPMDENRLKTILFDVLSYFICIKLQHK